MSTMIEEEEKKYTVKDIFDLYLNDEYNGNEKFVYIQEDHKYNIHGEFYRHEITLNQHGLWKEIFNKQGKRSNSDYMDISDVKQSKRLYTKQPKR